MNDTTAPATDASGRFVIRIDPALHEALRTAARSAGISLNEYCAQKLALPLTMPTGPLSEAVQRCFAQSGNRLIGVIVFGSWARGHAATTSDVDLMVVLDYDTRIGRDLYRAWDDAPLELEGHTIEPHFVHMPESDARISGMWAEVAVDGIIVFERDLQISRRLAAIRRDIMAGRIQQKRVHGQTYWVQAA
ncbi:MAG: toxin-antitoxin system HicB family antitoxin [Gemmatimonadota bacterium]